MTRIPEWIAAEHTPYRMTVNDTNLQGQPMEAYTGHRCGCGWDSADSTKFAAHIAEMTLALMEVTPLPTEPGSVILILVYEGKALEPNGELVLLHKEGMWRGRNTSYHPRLVEHWQRVDVTPAGTIEVRQ